jgi:hypothetical protein
VSISTIVNPTTSNNFTPIQKPKIEQGVNNAIDRYLNASNNFDNYYAQVSAKWQQSEQRLADQIAFIKA